MPRQQLGQSETERGEQGLTTALGRGGWAMCACALGAVRREGAGTTARRGTSSTHPPTHTHTACNCKQQLGGASEPGTARPSLRDDGGEGSWQKGARKGTHTHASWGTGPRAGSGSEALPKRARVHPCALQRHGTGPAAREVRLRRPKPRARLSFLPARRLSNYTPSSLMYYGCCPRRTTMHEYLSKDPWVAWVAWEPGCPPPP